MTDDRELLELAAKAAGITGLTEWSNKITDWDSPHHGGAALHQSGVCGQCLSWNPLTDDGDALRLAVKLNMLVDCFGECARVLPDKYGWSDGVGATDQISQVRRAIVRAAAEIGRAL
jgi:hypothetical protein